MATMVRLTFPHVESFIIDGVVGPRLAVVEFIEKDEKLAINVTWKGEQVVDFEDYRIMCELQIVKFLTWKGVAIDNITSKDYGKDRKASKEAIKEFLDGKKV